MWWRSFSYKVWKWSNSIIYNSFMWIPFIIIYRYLNSHSCLSSLTELSLSTKESYQVVLPFLSLLSVVDYRFAPPNHPTPFSFSNCFIKQEVEKSRPLMEHTNQALDQMVPIFLSITYLRSFLTRTSHKHSNHSVPSSLLRSS